MLTKSNGLTRVDKICGAVASALVLGAWAAPGRASMVAYSTQSTSGYTVSGGTVGTFSTNTSSSSAQEAVPSGSEAHSGLADALQS